MNAENMLDHPIEQNPDQNIESKQVLTFSLDGEQYGVDIINVREVLEYCEVTRVPRCPDFMAGVINLRGNVVPVINLRAEFGLSDRTPDIDTCIIIFEFYSADQQITLMGCIVDAVNEVVDVNATQLGTVPSLGNHIDPSFIEAMAKIDERFVMVLNVSRVLSREQIAMIDPDNIERTSDAEPEVEASSNGP